MQINSLLTLDIQIFLRVIILYSPYPNKSRTYDKQSMEQLSEHEIQRGSRIIKSRLITTIIHELLNPLVNGHISIRESCYSTSTHSNSSRFHFKPWSIPADSLMPNRKNTKVGKQIPHCEYWIQLEQQVADPFQIIKKNMWLLTIWRKKGLSNKTIGAVPDRVRFCMNTWIMWFWRKTEKERENPICLTKMNSWD